MNMAYSFNLWTITENLTTSNISETTIKNIVTIKIIEIYIYILLKAVTYGHIRVR